jgi:hypothetical protein
MGISAQKYELSFEWEKAPHGYAWADVEPCDFWGDPFSKWDAKRRIDFEQLVQSIPDGPFLSAAVAHEGEIPWTPEETPTLFAEFADVTPDEAGFQSWANKYGRLIHPETALENYVFIFTRRPELDAMPPGILPIRENLVNRHGQAYFREPADPVDFWYDEYRDLSFCVMLWEMAAKRDPRLDCLFEFRPTKLTTDVRIIKKEELDEIDFEAWKQDREYTGDWDIGYGTVYDIGGGVFRKDGSLDGVKVAKAYVQQVITGKLEKYPLFLKFESRNGDLSKVLVPSNLLSFMWYQLYLAQTGEINLRRCSICGKWENMEGHRSTWTKHANCANYGRVKRARAKRRAQEKESDRA